MRLRKMPAGKLEHSDPFGLRVIGAAENGEYSAHGASFER